MDYNSSNLSALWFYELLLMVILTMVNLWIDQNVFVSNIVVEIW